MSQSRGGKRAAYFCVERHKQTGEDQRTAQEKNAYKIKNRTPSLERDELAWELD